VGPIARGEASLAITDGGLYVPDVEGDADPPAACGRRRVPAGLAWAPDGRLISYTTGTTVRLLDSFTLVEVRALDWNIGKPRAVAFARTGCVRRPAATAAAGG
jgi:hypothetical protein